LPDVDELCAPGGLAVELELGGDVGDWAIAPDNISAPIAAPSINCFIMVCLFVRAMEPCALKTRWNLALVIGRTVHPLLGQPLGKILVP
jgi:hypothetical protein